MQGKFSLPFFDQVPFNNSPYSSDKNFRTKKCPRTYFSGNAQLKNPNGKILFNDPSTQIGLFGNGLSDTVVNFEFFDIDRDNGSVTLRTYNDDKKEIRYLGVNAKNFLHITSRGKCNAAKFKLERHVRRAA